MTRRRRTSRAPNLARQHNPQAPTKVSGAKVVNKERHGHII